jgi:hypothetical protein
VHSKAFLAVDGAEVLVAIMNASPDARELSQQEHRFFLIDSFLVPKRPSFNALFSL